MNLDETDQLFIPVNNAAAAQNTPLLDVEKEQLEYEFAVNVFGVIYMTQAVVGVGRMPPGGRIVNIGSIASKLLVPPPVYGAAKAAMDALTTFWAGEVSFLSCFPIIHARQLSDKYRKAWEEPWDHRQYTRTRADSNRYVKIVSGGRRWVSNCASACYV